MMVPNEADNKPSSADVTCVAKDVFWFSVNNGDINSD